jgi:hypothetical protein
VDLSGEHLDDRILQPLAVMLGANRHLAWLNLGASTLTLKGVEKLVDAVRKHNRSLITLELDADDPFWFFERDEDVDSDGDGDEDEDEDDDESDDEERSDQDDADRDRSSEEEGQGMDEEAEGLENNEVRRSEEDSLQTAEIRIEGLKLAIAEMSARARRYRWQVATTAIHMLTAARLLLKPCATQFGDDSPLALLPYELLEVIVDNIDTDRVLSIEERRRVRAFAVHATTGTRRAEFLRACLVSLTWWPDDAPEWCSAHASSNKKRKRSHACDAPEEEQPS